MNEYKIEYIGIHSPIITTKDKLTDIFKDIIQKDPKLSLQNGDIIAIASKVVAVEQNRIIDLQEVKTSPRARELALKSNLSPEFVEIVLNEADTVIGAVKGALLTLRNGDVQANAGVDKSNAGLNKAILLPSDPDVYALNFKNMIEKYFNVTIGVIIADSATRPLRIGTVGLAIGSAGFPAIVDIRGQQDLFGYKMNITLRNIADNLASGSNILMGESSESTPFVIIRGMQKLISDNKWESKSISDLRIDPKRCLYFGNMKYESI
jgi:coenzyme F420-0:L-glutamate ligase/coenzyme F420-1:gamma-L-glutamate ligase